MGQFVIVLPFYPVLNPRGLNPPSVYVSSVAFNTPPSPSPIPVRQFLSQFFLPQLDPCGFIVII